MVQKNHLLSDSFLNILNSFQFDFVIEFVNDFIGLTVLFAHEVHLIVQENFCLFRFKIMKIYNYSFPFLIQQLNFNFLIFLELDHFGVEAETLECYIEKVFEGVSFGSDDFHEIF